MHHSFGRFTEHIRDLKDEYKKHKATKAKVALSDFFEKAMPEFLRRMEAALADGSRQPSAGPLIGESLSLADVSLFFLVTDFFGNNTAAAKAALQGCPRLIASVDAVGSHPAIADYLATRPATPV